MSDREQHWLNLFGNCPTEGIAWYGIWTVYSPEKKLVKSYRGIRSFRANADKTSITHTNRYTYADGSTQEKQWQLEKQTCNQPDGVVHPAASSMTALSIADGISAWVAKRLEPGKAFGAELFFRSGHWRTSIAHIYDHSGNLEKITHIREHIDSYPPQPPREELKIIPDNWQGQKQFMTPNLQISAAVETETLDFESIEETNETLYLPDRIVINLPRSVNLGQELAIVAGKMVSDDEFQRLTVKYDNSGIFTGLIAEVFHPRNEKSNES